MNYSFMAHFLPQIFGSIRKFPYICTRKQEIIGAIAQLVEQRTENPCVPGSIPGGTTEEEVEKINFLFSLYSKTGLLLKSIKNILQKNQTAITF